MSTSDLENLLRETPAFASRFELKSLLGKGGMGAVFRARDTYRDVDVAIKVALDAGGDAIDEDSRLRRLWLNETRLAGKLKHPHIVELMEAGHADSFSYLVMECIEGGSLRDHVTPGKLLPVDTVVDHTFKVARALEFANTRGLLHRDVKPANVLLTAEGQPKVSDFGSVFSTESEDTQVLDVGTLPFVPPEQLDGKPPTIQSDIYAVGVMAYQLLTGAWPFNAETTTSMIFHKTNSEAIPVETRSSDIAPALRFAIHRALHRDPKVRYASWGPFCEDLAQLLPSLQSQREEVPESARYEQFKSMRFFDRFGETELWEAANLARAHRVDAGTVVFREGSPGASVFVLVSGALEITRQGVRLGAIEAGDCFGELAFVEAPDHIRSATVTATVDASFAEFDAQAVEVASQGLQAAMSRAIMGTLVKRIHNADARYLDAERRRPTKGPR